MQWRPEDEDWGEVKFHESLSMKICVFLKSKHGDVSSNLPRLQITKKADEQYPNPIFPPKSAAKCTDWWVKLKLWYGCKYIYPASSKHIVYSTDSVGWDKGQNITKLSGEKTQLELCRFSEESNIFLAGSENPRIQTAKHLKHCPPPEITWYVREF